MINEKDTKNGLSRRSFLKTSTAGVLSLTVLDRCLSGSFVKGALASTPTNEAQAYKSWDDIYRNIWQWDKVTWGCHTNQCLPASCSFRVYSKNGMVWREEQAAKADSANPDYPDFNPLGCQKGCGFHNTLTSGERLRYPMKRVGERGEGKWQRISWDQALEEVADSILDGHEEIGPESFVIDAPHVHAGSVAFTGTLRTGFVNGATIVDTNVALSDDFRGTKQTFGAMRAGFTADNIYDAELFIFSQANMAYTAIPLYHFVTEARYNGTEIVALTPDYNPSCVSADVHIPLKPASDAAFWLGVSQVIVEQELIDKNFVREQTDLCLLVRTDNEKYLRASEVEGGRDDQFYIYDEDKNKIEQASRSTLKLSNTPAMEGRWQVTLQDGSQVEVEPVLAKLTRMLNSEYTPEKAAKLCNLSSATIKSMALKVATRRTHLYIGWSSCKQHHGDLQERAAFLALGLTGNWGKPGTGFTHFFMGSEHTEAMTFLEDTIEDNGLELQKIFQEVATKSVKARDPEGTHEDVVVEIAKMLTRASGFVPPTPWMYYHAGYDKQWDRKDWSDPVYDKTFGEYMEIARANGHEPALSKVSKDKPPRVLMYISHNPLRRQRSGRSLYVNELFPKAKMIFGIETRMSSSAAYFDILLPAAWYYEKDDLTEGFLISPFYSLQQVAVQPPGEAKAEWEIFRRLNEKIAERAEARGMLGFVDNAGLPRLYSDVPKRFSMNGKLQYNDDVVDQFIKFNEHEGIFPKGYTYDKLREDGSVRMTGLGNLMQDMAGGTDYKADRPFFSYERYVEGKRPYPTLARRAQFYIEHDWFIQAKEAFPVYKDVPMSGGDHPFRIISGHPRHSVHTHHAAVPHFLKLHRGQPVAFINDGIAKQKNIKDGDMIRMFSDVDTCEIMTSISSAVGPDQIVTYMWEPFQFKDWKSPDAILAAVPKPTGFAVEYGQLGYEYFSGTPTPAGDRALRVDFELA